MKKHSFMAIAAFSLLILAQASVGLAASANNQEARLGWETAASTLDKAPGSTRGIPDSRGDSRMDTPPPPPAEREYAPPPSTDRQYDKGTQPKARKSQPPIKQGGTPRDETGWSNMNEAPGSTRGIPDSRGDSRMDTPPPPPARPRQ